MNKTFFPGFLQIFFFVFFIITVRVFAEDIQPDENPPGMSTEKSVTDNDASPDDTSKTPIEANTHNEAPEKTEQITGKKNVQYTQPAVQKQVTKQFSATPEDPSFLYETRFIPGIKTKEEFLPVELEKEVIKERIKEEKNFRKSLEKIQIRLPDLKQTLILVGLIIIILVYRTRARRHRSK